MSAHPIKAAIRSGDPYAISEVFTLPPLKHAFPSGTTPNPHSSSQNKFHERFSENGLDWSNAINSFLEARDYAAKVRTVDTIFDFLIFFHAFDFLIIIYILSSIIYREMQ